MKRNNSRVPHPKRVVATLALTGLAAVGLAGCNTDPGAAALVGSQRISDTQLTGIVRSALSNPSFASNVNSPAALARSELSTRIQLMLFRAQAAQEGVQVTPAQVNQQIQTYIRQFGSRQALYSQALQQGTPPSDIPVNIELNLLVAAIAKHAGVSDPTSQTSAQQVNQIALRVLSNQSKRLGVHVNPRYGTWNPARVSVQPLDLGVAKPAT
jgi:hypothetical protein